MAKLAIDIGGANLKAAHTAGVCRSAAFELWRRPGELTPRLEALASLMPPFDELAVTMTAELCDCFHTKRQGVEHVLDAVEALASGRPIGVWSTRGRLVSPAEARAEPIRCAAANWHALATWAAGICPSGSSLLIDTGSTTTDIVMLQGGRAQAKGLTDTQRLAGGELVYIGAARTPLAALGPTIVFGGDEHELMAERFATTSDVYLLTGQLPERSDCTDTADGRPMTRRCAAARIVRMIGADLETVTFDQAVQLAEAFAGRVNHRIGLAIGKVLGGVVPERVFLSGSGEFVADAASIAALPNAPRYALSQRIGEAAAEAACAFAMLQLPDQVCADAPIHVIKVGGGLLSLTDLAQRLTEFLSKHPNERQVLVIGGGDRADAIRQADSKQKLGDEASHWLAVRAMGLNTRQLVANFGRCRLVSASADCDAVWSAGEIAVVDPSAWLEREHAQGLTVPHRWSFTSDSIAAHVATQLQAQLLTLLKSTLPDGQCDVSEAARLGLVDEDFAETSASVPAIELVNLRNQTADGCVLR